MAGEKNNRRTRQKAVILEYIKENKDIHLKAEDIIEGLKVQGEAVSKATVYRFLKALEDEGLIRKYTLCDKVPACYQYTGDRPECRHHYHLMCSRCGEVVHVDSPALRCFMQEALEKEGFVIDESKTVFYGLCRSCKKNEVKGTAHHVD